LNFSPIQFGVVLPLSLLLVAQLQAFERLDVVDILQSFPVVLYYVSCERLHVLLGEMGVARERSVDTQYWGKVWKGKRNRLEDRGREEEEYSGEKMRKGEKERGEHQTN